MNLWLSLAALTLLGFITQPGQKPYQLSEIQVLFAESSERWSFFYGEPQVIRLGEQSLALTRGPATSPQAAPEALLVGGEPVYREVYPALPLVAQTSRTFPGLQFVVRTSHQVNTAWLFDGGWSRLGSSFASNTIQTVEKHPGSPRLAGLSEALNEAVLREILIRSGGRPVVVYELEPPLAPNRYQPAPSQSQVVALAVQYGLKTEVALSPPSPQPPNPRILRHSAHSAYTDQNPAAFLLRNQGELEPVWRLAVGHMLPAPTMPVVDFGQSRVVAFFWGQKPTGGFSIQLLGSRLVDSTLRVELHLSIPAPDAMVTQALTSPFLMLEVPARFTRVEFVDSSGRVLASAGR
jgi:hypothetical protein